MREINREIGLDRLVHGGSQSDKDPDVYDEKRVPGQEHHETELKE